MKSYTLHPYDCILQGKVSNETLDAKQFIRTFLNIMKVKNWEEDDHYDTQVDYPNWLFPYLINISEDDVTIEIVEVDIEKKVSRENNYNPYYIIQQYYDDSNLLSTSPVDILLRILDAQPDAKIVVKIQDDNGLKEHIVTGIITETLDILGEEFATLQFIVQ